MVYSTSPRTATTDDGLQYFIKGWMRRWSFLGSGLLSIRDCMANNLTFLSAGRYVPSSLINVLKGDPMRFAALCLVVAAAAFGAVELAAQAKPNLSGVWVGVGTQKPVRELNVKQDGSTLEFDGGPDYKATLKLDGSETKIIAPDGKPLLAKAAWTGNTLVVTLHMPEIKQDIRRQTWTIDATGQLVVVTEVLGPAATVDGKPQAATKEIFKRR